MKQKREISEAFHAGMLAALAIIYEFDQPTMAEEIINLVHADELLAVAKKNEDPWLKQVRQSVRDLKARASRRKR